MEIVFINAMKMLRTLFILVSVLFFAVLGHAEFESSEGQKKAKLREIHRMTMDCYRNAKDSGTSAMPCANLTKARVREMNRAKQECEEQVEEDLSCDKMVTIRRFVEPENIFKTAFELDRQFELEKLEFTSFEGSTDQ